MAGICGIAVRGGSPLPEAGDVAAMARALGTGAPPGGLDARLDRVWLASRPFGRRLALVRSSRRYGHDLLLAFHGVLYGGREPISPDDPLGWVGPYLLDRYLERGLDFLRHLRGDFALALWDGTSGTLHLATDPFRVHPLFYLDGSVGLVFGSRLDCLVASPAGPTLTIDPRAVVDVSGGSIIPSPRTIFREARKVPPGHVFSWRDGTASLRRYWNVDFLHPSDAPEAALAAETRRRFREAIEVRLALDGAAERRGAFLSGGVDSTTVTGVLTEATGGPTKTFSIGFAERRFNEIDYARIAARALASEHHEYFVEPRDVTDALPALLAAFDEPFANASAVAAYCCARLAARHGVDVLYAGDGGDELFAGNERYATQRLFDYYWGIPRWLREPVVRPVVTALAAQVPSALFVKAKKYVDRASIPYPQRLTSYGFLRSVSMAELFSPDLLAAVGSDYDPYGTVAALYAEAPAHTALDRQLYVDLSLAISDNDLIKVTRAAEAAGLDVRFPFLDREFVEFATTVPARMKMRGRRLRTFFKGAYAHLLPVETRRKRKHGFGLPIPVWLRTDPRLSDMMHELVLGPRSLGRGYFRREALERLVAAHHEDQTSFYGTALWNVMVLELWHRRRRA